MIIILRPQVGVAAQVSQVKKKKIKARTAKTIDKYLQGISMRYLWGGKETATTCQLTICAGGLFVCLETMSVARTLNGHWTLPTIYGPRSLTACTMLMPSDFEYSYVDFTRINLKYYNSTSTRATPKKILSN